MNKLTMIKAARQHASLSFLLVCAAFTISIDVYGATPNVAPQAGDHINFISCPLVRDTYVPCWLAEHDGELYYLGPQGDLGAEFYPPQLGHKALVEGVVSDQPRICGGVVLDPVKVSALPEIDVSCNTILPAAGHDNPPHHRTPGPSNSGHSERRRTEEPAPVPPFEAREFSVIFSFDVGQHLVSRNTRPVVAAARYAEAVKARKVEVVGYRAGALLSNGQSLKEREDIAQLRAEMVRNMLIHAGVDDSLIQMEFVDVGAPDGVNDFEQRRVAITVVP